MTPKTGRPRGRPKGSQSKKTVRSRELIKQAAATGVTVQEIMLNNARHFYQQALDAEATLAELTPAELGLDQLEPADQFKVMMAEVKKVAGFRQLAQTCAEGAAPYFAPRIAPISAVAGGKDEGLPLAERVKLATRRDAIASSAGKIVELKKSNGHANGHGDPGL